jgi:hypothetical protein
MKTRFKIVIATAATGVSALCLFGQGSLTPPGPPGPTMKTLDQLDAKLEKRTPISSLPFVINQPGSYYVTQDLTLASGIDGITINANDVSIDLNGFRLNGGNAGHHGIKTPGDISRTEIRNGTLINWAVLGVYLPGSSSRVEDLRIDGTNSGILVGLQSIVRRCNVRINAGGLGDATGIGAFMQVVIADCAVVAERAGCGGISVNGGATIRNCTVSGIDRTGIGIALYSGCVESVAVTGFEFGIRQWIANGAATIDRATVQDCSTGIFLYNDAVIANCVINAPDLSASGTGPGIEGSDRVTVVNTVINRHKKGMKMGTSASISRCTAGSNTQMGFDLGDGANVNGCTVRQNSGDGIRVAGGGLIAGNLCDANTGVSINATGFTNRIEGNTVLSSGSGIRLEAKFNIVIKNTLGTANPIVDVGGANQIAPTQNAATATNPFANLVH